MAGQPAELKQEQPNSAHMISVMSGVATLCGILIVLTYQFTLIPIRNNQIQIVTAAVFEVLPGATQQKIFEADVDADALTLVTGLDGKLPHIYAGYDVGGNLVGVAIEASGRGYADIIKVLYGYQPDRQAVTTFKVLESKETPGLGDKIARDPSFLANFAELDVSLGPDSKGLAHPVATVKHGTKTEKWQIDALSGATISSKAVGRLMRESTDQMIPIIQRHLDQLRKGA